MSRDRSRVSSRASQESTYLVCKKTRIFKIPALIEHLIAKRDLDCPFACACYIAAEYLFQSCQIRSGGQDYERLDNGEHVPGIREPVPGLHGDQAKTSAAACDRVFGLGQDDIATTSAVQQVKSALGGICACVCVFDVLSYCHVCMTFVFTC